MVTAACLHPLFKFDWIKDESSKIAAKLRIENLLRRASANRAPAAEPQSPKPSKTFFNFQKKKVGTSGNQELLDYIETTSDKIDVLNNFPSLKKLFIKFNVVLPTSASVERLFSAAGLILNCRRFKLSDDSFEQQLLLKLNRKYYTL